MSDDLIKAHHLVSDISEYFSIMRCFRSDRVVFSILQSTELSSLILHSEKDQFSFKSLGIHPVNTPRVVRQWTVF